MSERPLVSVLLCVHNGGRWLAEAVDSVLAQTWRELELLIIDDASDDGALEALPAAKDPRVRVHRNPARLGLTRSLNLGLGLAGGPYLARMDADDVCEPGRIEAQVRFLEAHPGVAACGTWARFIDAEGRPGGRFRTPVGRSIDHLWWRPPLIIHPTACFRTGALRELRYDEEFTHGQDYDLFLRLSRRHRVENLPRCLLRYRTHSGAITSARREDQLRTSYRIFQRHVGAPDIAFEEYAALLFEPTVTPLRRWAALRTLGRTVSLPLAFRIADNAKYAAKWVSRRLRGRPGAPAA